MSNSIWKTSLTFPEQERVICGKAPSYNNGIVIRRYTKNSSPRILLDGIKEWCYIDDLIAQADKAERLQAKLRTIAYMEQRLCIDDPVDILDDVLQIAKEEIKHPIKEK